MLPFLAASVISENNSRTGPGPLGLSIFLACLRTIADVGEEEEEEDPSSAKSMTDSSRQAGRKKKLLRNCAKIRAEESQGWMFFTAGRKKSEDFFQGRGRQNQ